MFLVGVTNTPLSYIHPPTLAMTKQTKEEKAARKMKATKEEAIQRAVKMYQDGLDGPESSRLGLRAVCSIVEKAVKGESGIEVKINHETVRARFNGVCGYCKTPEQPIDPDFLNRSLVNCRIQPYKMLASPGGGSRPRICSRNCIMRMAA